MFGGHLMMMIMSSGVIVTSMTFSVKKQFYMVLLYKSRFTKSVAYNLCANTVPSLALVIGLVHCRPCSSNAC